MLSLSFRYTVEFTPTDTEEVPEVCVAVLSAKGPPLTKDRMLLLSFTYTVNIHTYRHRGGARGVRGGAQCKWPVPRRAESQRCACTQHGRAAGSML